MAPCLQISNYLSFITFSFQIHLESFMKTFIISYLISVLPLIYAFFPSFQVAPIEAITRICFYMAFPLAIALSIMFIAVKHLLGFDGYGSLVHTGVHSAADNASIQTELKVS